MVNFLNWQMYVSREPVSQSPSEAERSPSLILKQLTFGRLPQCLCLHVQVGSLVVLSVHNPNCSLLISP